MIISRSYHSVHIDVVGNDSDKVCYILLPEGLEQDAVKWIEDASVRFGCSIAIISGMDWNRDMTPWSAPGVFKKEKDFSGGAHVFLKEMIEDYMPSIEQFVKFKKPQRYVVGVSLSGLFAIWSLSRADAFAGVASISGSLWFDNFASWLSRTPLKSAARTYMSLGDKEKASKDKRMATVEEKTVEVKSILEERGLEVILEMNDGTHFSPLIPRLEKAFAWLFPEQD